MRVDAFVVAARIENVTGQYFIIINLQSYMAGVAGFAVPRYLTVTFSIRISACPLPASVKVSG